MFPLFVGVIVSIVLFFLGQRRAAGFALLAGFVGLLLHRFGAVV